MAAKGHWNLSMAAIPSEVADDEDLHRILYPGANALRDGVVHYMAFYSSTMPHRISVDRARYRPAAVSLLGRADCRLAKLLARTVRSLRFDALPPLLVEAAPELGNDAHAEIIADSAYSKNKLKTRVCVELAEAAQLVPAA